MRKPKEPRPPMILCGSWKNYLLGIVEPSTFFEYVFDTLLVYYMGEEFDENQKKIKEYLDKKEKYNLDLIAWKIENRTATKEEYNWYAMEKRKRGIEQK